MKPEIYTLNGKVLLDKIRRNFQENIPVTVNFDDDIINSLETRKDSALYYQLQKLIKSEIITFSDKIFQKVLFFIDFKEAFPLKDRAYFDALFNNGFMLDFGDNEIKRFVPFLSSQSQSKKCIFAFIREDLFKPLQKRLDLDFPFEKNIECKSLAFLPKLYAYRSLYLSSATKTLRCSNIDGKDFFTPENIIVLPEKKNDPKTAVKVFTASANEKLSAKGEAVLTEEETTDIVSITCFDGEGIISPACSEIINKYLPKNLKDSRSFQVRMPFLKGVLHTVDFHKFLRDKGVEAEKLIVKDAFGNDRDLFKANIIIRPSMLKLFSLLESTFANKNDRKNFCGGDEMKYYFDKMHQYNHGLYVVKTEKSFNNTQYVRLSSQQLSTLDLSLNDVDGIVNEHIEMADAFCPKNIENLEKNNDFFKIEDKPGWMELLLTEPRFLKDPHIQITLKNHRVSRYNDISQGRILVRGESRFLSGDLYAFLVDIFGMFSKSNPSFKETYEKLKQKRIKSGAIYLAGANKVGQKVALLRSPHLSRNEDVCTATWSSDEYNEYFSELTGVVITGHSSYIPNALGGADFDGDQISIIYDQRIVSACYNSGYVEISGEESSVPFINIKELKSVGNIKKYTYVSSQAIYNSFSERIGNISNAATKIAAVQYDTKIEKNENMPSAALCTILTGNEIDATKKGLRPYIDAVVNFSKRINDDGKKIVNEIENYIKIKRELESKGGEIPSVKKQENGILVSYPQLSITQFSPNFDYNVVAQLLYRWANAFLEFKVGTTQNLSKKAYIILDEIFTATKDVSDQTEKIFEGFVNACDMYSTISKNRDYVTEKQNENLAKAVVRLKGQYDDIYSFNQKELSYKDRFEVLQDEIYELTKNTSKEELKEFMELIYSINKEKFNAEIFWPYVKNNCKNELLTKILELVYSGLILNFDYEGYRLLYYCLQNALINKEKQNTVNVIKENPYAVKYCEICNQEAKGKKSISLFEKSLAKIVRQDLAKLLEIDPIQNESESEIIRNIYPLKNTNTIKAFWKVFSEEQVINALGGEANA